MILPVIAYGNPVLRRVSKDISPEYPELNTLIANMWETMYNAEGVGLAAPQVGLPIRLFVIDATPFSESEKLNQEERDTLKNFKKVFINPKIEEETGEEWSFNEGCLSIPDIREEVNRKSQITLSYLDENFTPHTDTFDGLAARVVQHEYDHIEGVLFIDKLSSLKKRLLKGKLEKIAQGKIRVPYNMRFPKLKKER